MSIAGYQKVVQVRNAGSTTAYLPLPGNSASVNVSGVMLDDTDFTSTGWVSRIRGLKDYTLNVTNIYKSTDAGLNLIRDNLFSGASIEFQYLPNGTAGFSGQCVAESFNLSGDVGGIETADAVLNGDGTALSTV